MALTPMMQQYFEIKENYRDTILFYRLGDFYEMFFEDAELASKELELVLTGRDCGLEDRAPMCGIPYHSARNYIGRLVSRGYKVAICEQVEDPKLAKGIVRRDVIRVITPGTFLDEAFVSEERNNYIMGVYKDGGNYGLSFCDISTGEFYASVIKAEAELLDAEIGKFSPKEAVASSDELAEYIFSRYSLLTNARSIPDESELLLEGRFKSVSGGINSLIASSCSILLLYLEETQKTSLTNLTHLEVYSSSDSMAMDPNTKRNLELTENIVDKGKKGSLLWVLDDTATAMGGRNLRRWVEQPLISRELIDRRLEAVEALYGSLDMLEDLREALKGVYDIERIVSKVALKSVNPKELITLKNSLGRLPAVKEVLKSLDYGELSRLNRKMDTLSDIWDLLDSSISEDAPMTSKDGGIIKSGYSADVDELRDIRLNGKRWIAELEAKEREFTGIRSLKIGFNKVFGYYIEISRANFSSIPEGRYIRKQTLSNAERYITEELKVMEDKILGAEEKLSELEYGLFTGIRDRIEGEIERLKSTSRCIADLDCYQCLAKVARDNGYVKPVFSIDGKMNIVEGRHPVVEKMMDKGAFVSNDLVMDSSNERFLIITGPNMSGKSTFMRQSALIVLMAQIGSFVPAKKAYLSICDRIFTRIGASDDLAGGKSTFMVEMSEVSEILRNATSRSLIILDEVGRGTSTYDGLSIAWAVIEYILKNIRGSKSLFATHYHELVALEGELEGIRNYSVLVREVGTTIAFLRKIVPGGADESYGIEVAKLAGIPREILTRAKDILKDLEKKGKKPARIQKVKEDPLQIGFVDIGREALFERIKTLDVMSMTPMEAMNALYELNNDAKELN
jgi:DNA mismatch repair protein MutS